MKFAGSPKIWAEIRSNQEGQIAQEDLDCSGSSAGSSFTYEDEEPQQDWGAEPPSLAKTTGGWGADPSLPGERLQELNPFSLSTTDWEVAWLEGIKTFMGRK